MSEGFGLSLIEGMHFGVPCAMFTDMDSYNDIFDERAVVGIADRNNQCVAERLTYLLTSEWDAHAIKACSHRFDSETMGLNYIKAYMQL